MMTEEQYAAVVKECRIAGILLGEIHPDADELEEIERRKIKARDLHILPELWTHLEAAK